jgi:hypothetical protein
MSEFGMEEWKESSLKWFDEAKKQAADAEMWSARCRVAEYWTHRTEVDAAHAENERLRRDRDGWVKRALDAEQVLNKHNIPLPWKTC